MALDTQLLQRFDELNRAFREWKSTQTRNTLAYSDPEYFVERPRTIQAELKGLESILSSQIATWQGALQQCFTVLGTLQNELEQSKCPQILSAISVSVSELERYLGNIHAS